MRQYTDLIVVLIMCCFVSEHVHAETKVQTITSECTTKHTDPDGSRNNCHATPTVLTAPDGYVFAEKSVQGGYTSKAGSENKCSFKFDNYIEVISGSGIMQPRTVSLKAYALSPKGALTGKRGWSKCKYTIKLSKYLN
ncbi:hypothetical protein [Cellvibrio sp.]